MAATPIGWRAGTATNHEVDGGAPVFSANDRSRWVNVASLLENGTWHIDDLIQQEGGIRWDTIDKVRHRGPDGAMHFYSSKPPLLAAFVAVECLAIEKISGWKFIDRPEWFMRIVLAINHTICMVVLMVALARVLEPMFVSDWTRYFVLSAAGFGTFLTSFSLSLNNHLPAATAAMLTLMLLDRILRLDSARRWKDCFLAGLFAAIAAAMDLPAVSLTAAAGLIVLTRSPIRCLTAFVPGVAIVAAAMLGLNYQAHGSWRLPYSWRNDGALIAEFEDASSVLNEGKLTSEIESAIREAERNAGVEALPLYRVERGRWMGQTAPRWIVTDSAGDGRYALRNEIRFEDDGEVTVTTLRHWGNWYDYPGSYWRTAADRGLLNGYSDPDRTAENPNNGGNGGNSRVDPEPSDRRSMVDRGEPDRMVYAFHFLVGHHGILTLTPLWILSFAGMVPLAFSRVLARRTIGWIAILLTIVVIGFYLSRPAHDCNYGGWTSGPRWVFWLIPFWLLAMSPVVQMLARWNWGRTLCLLLLSASMLSAMYSWNNPWVQPWLYVIWQSMSGQPVS